MKHVPSIIDYSLLLDYAVASGDASLVTPKKEESGIEGLCKVKDEYYWVKYKAKEDKQFYYYKTPFKKTKKLINVREQHIKSLVEMWINQYLIFAKGTTNYIRNYTKEQLGPLYFDLLEHFDTFSIKEMDNIDNPLGYNYSTCLLLYTLLTVPAKRIDTIGSSKIIVEYKPYTWSDINKNNSVITVKSINPDILVDPIVLSIYGVCVIYKFDKNKDYQVQIGSNSVPIGYKGSDYAGLVVGFIIDPSAANIIFIEQLVNNGLVYTVNVNGQGPNTELWGGVKVKRILPQSLESAIIPYYFPISRGKGTNVITSNDWLQDNVSPKIIGTIDPDKGIIDGLIPNYFDKQYWSDNFYVVINKHVPVYIKNIVKDNSAQQSFKQVLVSRLRDMVQEYKITIYDITGNKLQVKSSNQNALYLYNPLDPDLVLEMLRVFGIRNIVSEKDTYDCYQSFKVTSFLKVSFLDNIEKHWTDYAAYSLTEL